MSDSRSKADEFDNVAKDLGCDESDDALDKAFGKLNPTVKKKEEGEKYEKDE